MPVAKTKRQVIPLERPLPSPLGHRVGRFAGWSEQHGPLVDYAGNTAGPLPVRSLLPLDEAKVQEAIRSAREILLAFENGASHLPLVLGWIEQPTMSPADKAPVQQPNEALLDGRRVVLEAADEIVLRCGKASITLRRNGRVVIRGAYVETESEGVNRIKGGTVQIN